MARYIAKVGLTPSILGIVALCAVSLGTLLSLTVPPFLDNQLTASLDERGREFAANALSDFPSSGHERNPRLRAHTKELPEFLEMWRFRGPRGELKFEDLEPLVGNENTALAHVGLDFINSRDKETIAIGGAQLLVVPFPKDPNLQVVMALDRSRIELLVDAARTKMYQAIFVSSVVMLLLSWLFTRWFLLRPIAEMKDVARNLAVVDVSRNVEQSAPLELNELGTAISEAHRHLRETWSRLRSVSENVAGAIEHVSFANRTASNQLELGIAESDTASLASKIDASRSALALHIDELMHITETARSTLVGISESKGNLTTSASKMRTMVDETQRGLERINSSIFDMNAAIVRLLAAAGVTTSAATAMNAATERMRTDTAENTALSEQLTRDVNQSIEAVQQTLQAMSNIQASARSVSRLLEDLARKAEFIVKASEIIDEVAKQTSTLAMNAELVAAQAGEKGATFARVAEQLKSLSEDAETSAREIGRLVHTVRKDVALAVGAMNNDVHAVEECVLLGEKVRSSLAQVQSTSLDAKAKVGSIIQISGEQVASARLVNASIERMRDAIENIQRMAERQDQGSMQVNNAAAALGKFANAIWDQVNDQSDQTLRITQNTEAFGERLVAVDRVRQDQVAETGAAVFALQKLHKLVSEQHRTLQGISAGIEVLRAETAELRSEIRRFQA